MSDLTGNPTSIGESVLSAFGALANGAVETLATIIGTWETARQSIRTVATGIAAAAMQSTLNTAMAKYQEVPLSPAVLADMSIRNLGAESGIDLVQEASYSGIDAKRFAALALDTGESYGIVDALRLWHRGTYLTAPQLVSGVIPGSVQYAPGQSLGTTYGITEGELDTVIYYSRVRDQFIPDLKQLSWDTMSGADAVNLAVKGIATTELAEQFFLASGGMPEQFQLLYEAAGDSVGVEHAVELHAHGDITTDQLQSVILQSRINPRFYDVALLANRRWLPPYEIKAAVAGGVTSIATATRWMVEMGYPADQAAAFVSGAAAGTVHKAKAETEAMVLAEYEAQIITEAEATKALADLGYTATAIPYLLETYTARRVITMRNAAITRARTAFVDYLITAEQASADLVLLGLPTAAVSQFLTAWTIEQRTNIKRLSAAQVGKLAVDGIIDGVNAVARWVQMGYAPEEADLLLHIYAPGSKATAGTVPSVTTVPPSGQRET